LGESVDTPDEEQLAGESNQDLEPSGSMAVGDEEIHTTQMGTRYQEIGISNSMDRTAFVLVMKTIQVLASVAICSEEIITHRWAAYLEWRLDNGDNRQKNL
jgi:hypothetical protein